MQSREFISEVQSGNSGVHLSVIDHSLNALGKAGMIRIEGGVVRMVRVGYPDEGVALILLEMGQELMNLILPYLPEA